MKIQSIGMLLLGCLIGGGIIDIYHSYKTTVNLTAPLMDRLYGYVKQLEELEKQN